MGSTRREFICGCSAAIAALSGGWISDLVFAASDDTTPRDILVTIFLRGGCDGLGLLAPADDANYVAARGDLRIETSGPNAGIRLPNAPAPLDFRLHPKAGPLKELYDDRSLAIVHACGLTSGTRSHFEAMDYMERGFPNGSGTASGWLARHLTSINAGGMIPALAASSNTPTSLQGNAAVVATNNVANFKLIGDAKYTKQQQTILQSAYAGSTGLHRAGLTTLDTIGKIDNSIPKDANGNPRPYVPENGADYPTQVGGSLSNALKTVAQLIKMDVGLQVATVDYGGWDTHESQANVFPNLIDGLSRAISAFYNDLVRYYHRLTVVVMSEFGRRLRANRSGGTDHGHGNVMLVLGGYVNGGKIFGAWPGLANEQLDNGVDLAITTDYRTVLSEIVAQRLANPNLAQVFPNFTVPPAMGIVRTGGSPNPAPTPGALPLQRRGYLPSIRR